MKQLLRHCLSSGETNITLLNGRCLQAVCEYIGIPFKLEISSRLGLNYAGIQTTCDWALRICEQLGASAYYNPPGGEVLYEKEQFSNCNIELHFVKPHFREYDQHNGGSFMPGLSIIDIMMFNHPAQIKDMLTDYSLL
nr:WbqC family protein [Paraflavitalea speifideiaquila]